ncbi:MAG TPA: hypothetical protein PKI11_21060, partial [Candidatus Hydrogenedentes bacterium]|nr:hypothetical protein [Candidatus Hydrogenedentota bacterium]
MCVLALGAVFAASAAADYTLTINVVGQGTTTPAPGDHTYPGGTFVSLDAFPDPGWAFDQWQGAAVGTLPSAAVVMDADKTVTAVFVEGGYMLVISVDGIGTTSPPEGTHFYVPGRTVYVAAYPSIGVSVFDHWEGDLTGTDRQQELLMDADKTVVAVFAAAENFTLTTAVVGNGSISPAAGAHTFLRGTVVPIRAFGDPGWAFDHWEGDLSGTNQFNQMVTMDADKSVTAVFVAQDHSITIGVMGGGQTIPPPGTYGALDG